MTQLIRLNNGQRKPVLGKELRAASGGSSGRDRDREYRRALDWIHSIGMSAGMRPGLERVRTLLEKMGHPEQGINYIHVGGTNGKGSVASLAAAALQEAGLQVG